MSSIATRTMENNVFTLKSLLSGLSGTSLPPVFVCPGPSVCNTARASLTSASAPSSVCLPSGVSSLRSPRLEMPAGRRSLSLDNVLSTTDTGREEHSPTPFRPSGAFSQTQQKGPGSCLGHSQEGRRPRRTPSERWSASSLRVSVKKGSFLCPLARQSFVYLRKRKATAGHRQVAHQMRKSHLPATSKPNTAPSAEPATRQDLGRPIYSALKIDLMVW